MDLSNELFCEAGSFSCCRFNHHSCFEALCPCTVTLGCSGYLAPQFLPVYLHLNVGLPSPKSTTFLGPPAATLLGVLSAQLPISTPPTGLDECFFFNSLVVVFPYSSIFWQFWWFFVFKFVDVHLLVVRGGTVCLPIPPSWLEEKQRQYSLV